MGFGSQPVLGMFLKKLGPFEMTCRCDNLIVNAVGLLFEMFDSGGLTLCLTLLVLCDVINEATCYFAVPTVGNSPKFLVTPWMFTEKLLFITFTRILQLSCQPLIYFSYPFQG